MKVPQSSNRELPPRGNHISRLIWITDMGTQKSSNPKYGDKRKVKFTFELCHEIREFNGEKKPMVISSDFSFISVEKGKLRDFIFAWTGIDLSKNPDFDVTTLLGKQAMINVAHTEDEKYANLMNATPLPNGMEAPPAVNTLRSLSLEKEEFDLEVFKAVPKYFRTKIIDTPEFKKLGIKWEEEQEEEEAPF